MGTCEADLEAEALGHASEHVSDMGQGSAQERDILLSSIPANSGHSLQVLGNFKVQVHVAEVLLEGTAGSGDGHHTILNGAGAALRDAKALLTLDLHLLWISIKYRNC
eukprot:Tbor_TRINITY_DN5255_c6_g2::TRINITY_DN5255_c6_g2_i2::g.16625::m.16625